MEIDSIFFVLDSWANDWFVARSDLLYTIINSFSLQREHIFFTISVFIDNKLSIDYTDGEVFRYLFDIENNILNFDQRDQRRYEVLSDINRKIIDIVIFSILLYLEYDRKG